MIAAIDPTSSISATSPVSAPAASAGRSREELLRTVSASRLGTWLQCHLKFYFRYVVGITKPTTPARHVGTVVHAVLEQWSLARWRRAPLDAEAARAVFEQLWTPQESEPIAWPDDEPETEVKAEALGLLEMYLRETPIPADEKPEAVEVNVELDLRARGLPILVGILDLVRAGGRIVDYKTAGKTPNPAMTLHINEAQLTAYALLYREATDAQTTRFLRQLESYVRGLEGDDFVPSPGFGCAACEFFKECRAWR